MDAAGGDSIGREPPWVALFARQRLRPLVIVAGHAQRFGHGNQPSAGTARRRSAQSDVVLDRCPSPIASLTLLAGSDTGNPFAHRLGAGGVPGPVVTHVDFRGKGVLRCGAGFAVEDYRVRIISQTRPDDLHCRRLDAAAFRHRAWPHILVAAHRATASFFLIRRIHRLGRIPVDAKLASTRAGTS